MVNIPVNPRGIIGSNKGELGEICLVRPYQAPGPRTRLDIRFDGIDGIRQGTVRWVSADATFTPYFALTEHDRSRLSFLAEVDIDNASSLPTGLPLEAWIPVAATQ